MIAEILYHQFPKATEGELSRLRATLVNRDALADIARQFDLGNYIFLVLVKLEVAAMKDNQFCLVPWKRSLVRFI